MTPNRTRRARREGLRLAKETRDNARRHRRRLGDAAADELQGAAALVEAAAASGDAEKLSAAAAHLSGLVDKHLSFARKGLLREYTESVVVAVLLALLLRAFVVEAFKIPSSSMAPTLLVGDHILVNKLVYGPRLPFTARRLLQLSTPRRGDVIVFQNPREPRQDYIKRVVGLPGDIVEIRDEVVYVNGVPQPRVSEGHLTYEERSESNGHWRTATCLHFVEELALGPIPRPASELPRDLQASWNSAAADGIAAHDVLQCDRVRLGGREGPFEVVQKDHVFVLGDNRDRSADSRSEGGWQVPFGLIKGKATLVWLSWGNGGASLFGTEGLRLERLFKRIE